jgi:hypothetical protein
VFSARNPFIHSRLLFWCALLFLAVSILVFTRFCLRLHDFQVDDAFITYRFGDRLAHDATLRWNLASLPTGAGLDPEALALLDRPVEGYTSFLAVLVSAAFIKLGLPPLICWKILGILLALATAAAAAWGAEALFRGLGGSKRGARAMGLACAALYLAHPLVALHAMSGMETALFGFLLMGLTALALRIVFLPDGAPWRLNLMAFGFLLLGMTRPEGVLWALIAALAVWVGLRHSGTTCNRRRFVRAFLLFFVLPGFIYFVWRWVYFSSLLPATFHAKAGASARPSPLGRLYTYLPSHWIVWQFLRDNWLWPALVLIVGIVTAMWGGRSRRRLEEGMANPLSLESSQILATVLLFFASLACVAFFSSVHMLMGFGHRFLFPFGQTFLLTLLVPLVGVCGRMLYGARRRHPEDCRQDACTTNDSTHAIDGGWRKHLAGALGGILLGLMLVSVVRTVSQVNVYCLDKDHGVYRMVETNRPSVLSYRRLGSELDAVAERVGRRLTLFHHNMGELMFYAPHWDSVDPVGLVDLPVNRLGYSADYVFARRPDLFILPSKQADTITPYAYTFGHTEIFPDIGKALFTDPRMADYVYLGYYAHGALGPTGRMHLLVRRELLDRQAWIRNALVLGLDLVRSEAVGSQSEI